MIVVDLIFNIDFLDMQFLYIATIFKYKIFYQISYIRFPNMNNATIINIFNSDNAILLILRHNIVKSWQSLHTESWNLNPWLKKAAVTNHAFFATMTFSRISSFPYISSIVIQHSQDLFIKNYSLSVSTGFSPRQSIIRLAITL